MSNEVAALLGCTFDRYTARTPSEINLAMLDIQAGQPISTLPNVQRYPEMCKNMAKEDMGVMDILPDESGSNPTSLLLLTEAGYEIVRPTCGQFCTWSKEHNLALKNVLGSPRRSKDGSDTSSNLYRMAILSFAYANQEFTSIQFSQNYESISPTTASKHSNHLVESGIFIKDGTQNRAILYRLDPSKREAIGDLLELFKKMVSFDANFYAEGHVLADKIIRDPLVCQMLIRRSERASTHTNGNRLDHKDVVSYLIRVIVQRGFLSSVEIPTLNGLENADKGQQYKIGHALRQQAGIRFTTVKRSRGIYEYFPADSSEAST